jgi:hypothetical protein
MKTLKLLTGLLTWLKRLMALRTADSLRLVWLPSVVGIRKDCPGYICLRGRSGSGSFSFCLPGGTGTSVSIRTAGGRLFLMSIMDAISLGLL